MNTSLTFVRHWVVFCSLGWATAAYAVLPPQYEAMYAWQRIEEAGALRAKAHDWIRMRVTDMTTSESVEDGCPARVHWLLEGEVVTVKRGSLRPGATIHIQANWTRYDCPGPIREPIPSIVTDYETDAFLSCDGSGRCEPAAGEMSFMSDAVFQMVSDSRRRELDAYVLMPRPPVVAVFHRGRKVPDNQDELMPRLRDMCDAVVNHSNASIRIGGFTDRRRTSEVSLALAWQYAAWGKKQMIQLGCPENRIEAISFGKERTMDRDVQKNRAEIELIVH